MGGGVQLGDSLSFDRARMTCPLPPPLPPPPSPPPPPPPPPSTTIWKLLNFQRELEETFDALRKFPYPLCVSACVDGCVCVCRNALSEIRTPFSLQSKNISTSRVATFTPPKLINFLHAGATSSGLHFFYEQQHNEEESLFANL